MLAAPLLPSRASAWALCKPACSRHGHACPHALTLHWMATYLKMLVTPLSHVICGPCLQTMHFGCRPTGNDGLTPCMHTVTHVSCILDNAWCTSYADQFLFGTAACYVAMQAEPYSSDNPRRNETGRADLHTIKQAYWPVH